MILTKVTPLLVVDAIEPVIPFWESQLGYKREVEVPHEEALGFVLLTHAETGGAIMLQTRASLAADLPAIAARSPEMVLYVDVGSLSEALAETRGCEVLVPRRTTFYGAHEAAVLDPSGKVVIFAEHG
jgi:uncharacterized glyoxalase superfamily protein PhnB